MAEMDPGAPATTRNDPACIAREQFERAQQVIANGDFDYALRLLRSCLDLDPSKVLYRQTLRRTTRARYRDNERGSWLAWLRNAPARWRLKRAVAADDHAAALAAAEEILARNPWDVPAMVAVSEAAEHLGWLDVAAWSIESARTHAPKDVALIRRLAHLYEKLERYEQAAAMWQVVLKRAPDDTEAASQLHHLAARETIQRGRYVETLIGGESVRSQSSETLPEPGVEVTEDHPRAVEAATLRQKITREPQRRENYLRLAALYRELGDARTARIVLERGLEATGEAFELRAAVIDLDIDPYRALLAETEAALEKDPDAADLARQRARLRKEINNRELELYKKWAKYAPNDPAHRYEMGVRLLRAGRVEDAIRELQLSRDDARFRWRSTFFLGQCHRARNDPAEAVRHFEATLAQMPPGETDRRKEVLYLLATLYAAGGDRAKAITYGESLVAQDAGFRDIAALMERWQADGNPT